MAKKLYFSFVVTVEGINPDGYTNETYPADIFRALQHAGIDADYREDVDPEDTEHPDVWEGDSLATLDASGILQAAEFFGMLDRMGYPLFEDCETMGTLGGPLGGWAPDFSFIHESRLMVFSMRATPVLRDTVSGELSPVSDRARQSIRNILTSHDYWSLSRGNIARALRDTKAARSARRVG